MLAQDAAASTWLLADHMGTIRDLVEENEQLVNHIKYTAYGAIASMGNASSDSRYLYSSREFDPELRIYFYRGRYYEPTLGTFLGEDPLRFDGEDSNLVRFVGNGPVQRIDPWGLLFWDTVNAGESYGDHAAQYWADRYAETGNWWYQVPGVFASLWTPCTSDQTLLTLIPISRLRVLKNAPGVEYRFTKDFRVGWHRFTPKRGPLKGQVLNRPHYHTRPGIGWHRPWE
ncbi:MAG: RHS repeat-associated core domain-containing protein [Planctomycetaceae bacterium]|nr:RHS repeat-associated core domain-containing protein [Planctomycetaceae bacterium]